MITKSNHISILRKLEKLGKLSKTGYWEVDLETNYVYWSEMTRKIHEVPEDFVPKLETGISFYLKGKSRTAINHALKKAIKDGLPFDLKVQLLTHVGKIKWVRTAGYVIKEDGKIIGLYGSIQDIDTDRAMEIRLNSLTERIKIATKAANIGVFELDLQTNELYWDDQMYELYGILKENFTGHYDAWENSLHPKDKERVKKELEVAIKDSSGFQTTYRIVKTSGVDAYIDAKAVVIEDDNGNPKKIIGVNSDITLKTILEKQLSELYLKQEQQNKFLRNFAHTMTHNLRSNSGNLSMIIALLQNEKNEDKRAMFIEMLEQSTDRLEDTIKQLNETVSIKFGEKQTTEKVNIKDAIDNATQNINALIDAKKAEINIAVAPDLMLHGYRSYFESIFQNFLTNSLKYARKEVAPKVAIKAKTNEEVVTIKISDNGMGIDLEKHGYNIFEMYKTFHGNKDAKGIGLFLTKEQIEAMGGTIKLESTPGKGTTFFLTFKL